MKKKVLFSLVGLLAVVSLVYATKFTDLVNSSDYQLWNLYEPADIAGELGYDSETGNGAIDAQAALDNVLIELATVDEYVKPWTKTNVDAMITKVNEAKNFISINQYKIVHADAIAGWNAEGTGSLTCKDFDKVHEAKVAFGNAEAGKGIEVLTLDKTWDEYLPGLKNALTELDNSLGKDLETAWTNFLEYYPKLSQITEGYIDGANKIEGRELVLTSQGHNVDLSPSEIVKDSNSDYKLLQDFYNVASLIATSKTYKAKVEAKYSWEATQNYCSIYKNMEVARALLYDYKAVNKYQQTLTKIKEEIVVRLTMKNDNKMGKIYAFYAQAVKGENGVDEDARKYVYQVFPKAEIEEFYQAALSQYKADERTELSKTTAQAFIDAHKDAEGILSKTTETVLAADKSLITKARTEIANLYNVSESPKTTLAADTYKYTEISYTDANDITFTNSEVNFINGDELDFLGNSTQYRLTNVQDILVESITAAQYLTNLYKAATIDELTDKLVTAYKMIYADQINQNTVNSEDAEMLSNAYTDYKGLGWDGYSTYGTTGITVGEDEYKMFTFKRLEWNTTNETFESTAADYTTDGKAMIVVAKNKLNAYLNEQPHGNIEAKSKAATWKSDWEEQLIAITNVTPENKKTLEEAETAYNALNTVAKSYIDYKTLFAQLIDIVSTDVTNFGILFGDGTWCALDQATTTFPETYPTEVYTEGENKNVPSSWTAIENYINAVRALESATITTTNGAEVKEVTLGADNLANAVAFVWGKGFNIEDAKLAEVVPANVVVVDDWKKLEARANKITYSINKPFKTPMNVKANIVEVNKGTQNIVQTYWQSLYLPFNLTAENLNEINKVGADVYYLAGAIQKEAENDEEQPTLSFGFRKKTEEDITTYTDDEIATLDGAEKEEAELVNNVATFAYKPYLIKGNVAEKLTLTKVNIKKTPKQGDLIDGVTTAADGEGSIEVSAGKTIYTFVSSTQPTQIDTDIYYLGHKKSSGETAFWTPNKATTLPASALFVRSTSKGIHYVIGVKEILDDEEATGIESIETENSTVEGIYTINGVKVNEASKPGLYIINGKKVLVK